MTPTTTRELIRPERLPPAGGLRVGTVPDVQLVSRAGPYEVELLVRVAVAGALEIVGQVTRAERVHEPVSNLELVLYDADAMASVSRVHTDHFGEFNLGSLPPARYYVALGTEKNAPCLVVWEGDD